MTKQSGLGDALWLNGYDLSGDVQNLSKVSGTVAPIDVTSINESAFERIGGLRSGQIDMNTFFNPGPAANAAHPVLSALPTSDVLITYARGTAVGNPAACMQAKQLNYDGTRAQAGTFTFAVAAQSDGYGLEWGTLLTAGLRTDTSAQSGAPANDFGAATSFGFQAYLHVTAFTGTDVTLKIRDSADNSTFADLAGGAFAQIITAPQTQRIAVGGTATVREFVRVASSTTGGFTSVTFAVVFVKNLSAVNF